MVDTKAVIRALDSGKLLGASLDVYENEGNYVPKDFSNKDFDDKLMQELIDRDDMIYTPHTAFYTETAVKKPCRRCIKRCCWSDYNRDI